MIKIVQAEIRPNPGAPWGVHVVGTCPDCHGEGEWDGCTHCSDQGAVQGTWYCHVSCGCAGSGVEKRVPCGCGDIGCDIPVSCAQLRAMEETWREGGALVHPSAISWYPAEWGLSTYSE